MVKFLRKKFWGKSWGEWIHYLAVWSVVSLFVLIEMSLFKFKPNFLTTFLIPLVLFIILDTIAEKLLIK